MDEFQEKEEGISSRLLKMSKSLGSSLSKDRKSELYFGKPQKGMYPMNSGGIDHIHDVWFKNKSIYPVSRKEELALLASRSDTKDNLIKELVEQTHLTRTEASQVVNDLLDRGILREIEDRDLGKVLIFGGRYG